MKQKKSLHINLSVEIHRELKMYCAHSDLNMKQLVEELIMKFLENRDKTHE